MKSMTLWLVALLFCAGCNFRAPSETTAYNLACEALAGDQALSASNPEPVPFEEADLHIAKNAGCVILPYTFVNSDGDEIPASYTVWLKRIERNWVVERSFVTPTYAVDAP